jgi:hypothetical protein
MGKGRAAGHAIRACRRAVQGAATRIPHVAAVLLHAFCVVARGLYATTSPHADVRVATHPPAAGSRAITAAGKRAATAIADGTTVPAPGGRIAAKGRACGRLALAQMVLTGPPSLVTGGATVARIAAAVANSPAVLIAACRLAGERQATSRGAGLAQVILAGPSVLRAGGRAVGDRSAAVADVAAVLVSACRRAVKRGAARRGSSLAQVILAGPSVLCAGGFTVQGRSAAVANVATVLVPGCGGAGLGHAASGWPCLAQAIVTHPPGFGTGRATVERPAAAIPDHPTVVVSARRHTGKRLAGPVALAQSLVANPPVASGRAVGATVERIAAAIADGAAVLAPRGRRAGERRARGRLTLAQTALAGPAGLATNCPAGKRVAAAIADGAAVLVAVCRCAGQSNAAGIRSRFAQIALAGPPGLLARAATVKG